MKVSASSSKRKRALVFEDSIDGGAPRRRSKVSYALLETELESLRSELEHEQSLRELDKRRSIQLKTRLEKQLRLATEEAEETKALLEEVREANEDHMKSLRDGRKDALRQLRETQHELHELQLEKEEKDDEDNSSYDSTSTGKGKIKYLESQLEARTEEVDSLRQRLDEVVAEYREDLEKISQAKAKINVSENTTSSQNQSSPAPKAVMKELNRTRISLDESERKFRQLQRKANQWKEKAQSYIQQKEAAASAKLRVSKLEMETTKLRQKVEEGNANNAQWENFIKEIGETLGLPSTNGPPEVATVMRYFNKKSQQMKALEEEKSQLEEGIQQISEKNDALKKETRDANTALSRVERNAKEKESQLEKVEQRLKSAKSQESIWARESESLRKLLKTFDDVLPEKASPTDATVKTLNLSISAAREEIQVLKKEQDRLVSVTDTKTTELDKLQKEHDRVLDKFTKLRDALMKERSKAEKAESRAQYAETLAGKGQFNPEHTRALHLEKNPLSDAIRERFQKEISALKKRLEEVTGDAVTPSNVGHSTIGDEVDPEKLHKRLKDTFKEQIGIFREGVYLITGFKIDMLLDKSTPYFKVRSVYGEREEDVLIFNWPKGIKQPKSLDLRATDFAKVLSQTDAYQYLTKYDSMPGFMANTQLSLLEKCTFI